MRVNLHDLGFNDFLDLIPKAQARKAKRDELDFLQRKSVVHKGEREKIIHPPKWYKVFGNHVSDKDL